MPRWSVLGGGQPLTTPSIAGLPGCSACVWVGPLLLASDPSSGFTLFWSPAWLNDVAQLVSLRIAAQVAALGRERSAAVATRVVRHQRILQAQGRAPSYGAHPRPARVAGDRHIGQPILAATEVRPIRQPTASVPTNGRIGELRLHRKTRRERHAPSRIAAHGYALDA